MIRDQAAVARRRNGRAALLAAGCLLLASFAAAADDDYSALVALFGEFREFVPPRLVDGVPDYSPPAMSRQYRELGEFRARLAAIDDSDWPPGQRVDYMLVLAEMRGLEFQHVVVRPWQRDPAFYSTTNLGFGPKMHGAMPVPELPLTRDEAATLTDRLRAVPRILAQARANLSDMRGDLARLAIVQKDIERNVYERLAADLDEDHPLAAATARRAAEATAGFADWLRSVEDTLPPHGGVGRDNYNWLLRHVLLFPYTWEEMRTLGEREYQRSMVFLKLEEHRNAGQGLRRPAARATPAPS